MFTGLVLTSARVESYAELVSASGTVSARLEVSTDVAEAHTWVLGDSIAVNGCCLTIVRIADQAGYKHFHFDLSSETLEKTNLKNLALGAKLHLESALKMGQPLGGHLVSGHVDAAAVVKKLAIRDDGYTDFHIALDGAARKAVAPYLVDKGSIAVDGVSLTVNAVKDSADTTLVEMMLIPHTLEITRFATLRPGDLVNVEADLLAKHFCRYSSFREAACP